MLWAKVGFKPILATGMVLIAAGLVWFSQISPDGTFLADILGPSLAAVGLGLAILAAIANAEIGTSQDKAVLTDGFSSAFLVGSGFAVLGLLATLLRIRSSDSKAHVDLGSEPAAESSS